MIFDAAPGAGPVQPPGIDQMPQSVLKRPPGHSGAKRLGNILHGNTIRVAPNFGFNCLEIFFPHLWHRGCSYCAI